MDNEYLKKNTKYYEAHKQEFLRNYSGKILLIYEEKLIDSFDDFQKGYFFAIEKYEEGTFLLQLCTPEGDTQTFHTRVAV
jgi:hypothetical protein